MGIENTVFQDDQPPQCDALFLNSLRAEMNNLISNSGQSPVTSNLNQLGIATAIMASGSDFYTDSGGSANTYVLSPVAGKSAPNAYFVGMRVRFIVGHTNTGASTVNANGLGVKNLKGRDATSNPAPGDLPAGQLIEAFYDGTNFVVSNGVAYAVASVPSGAMFSFPGTTAPAGYLLCFGQAISRITYSTLFGLIGTTWGSGDGTGTFNLPDFRGRVIIGLDNMGGTNAGRMVAANASILGINGGGSELNTPVGTVSGTSTSGDTTLNQGQMPSHNHPINLSTFNGHGGFGSGNDTPTWNGSSLVATDYSGGNGSHNHVGGSLSASFTGTAGNTTQPWLAMNVIIKT